MVDEAKVAAFIAHYASEFYDPVKAHEYYLRNRKLKGRFSTKGFTKTQKEAFTYAKAQIHAKQQKDTAQARSAKDTGIAQARAHAAALRASIATRLTNLADNAPKKERERIAAELRAIIEKYRAKYAADKSAAASSAKSSLAREFKNIKTRVR
jgi:hypothetical protein